MISFEEARRIILETPVKVKEAEEIDFMDSMNRVLAEDIRSDMNMPPFDKTAVDGFACRKSDISKPLKVIEHVPAGQMPQKEIGEGECSKVMTGAPVPKGADMVLMVEDCEELADSYIQYTGTSKSGNICFLAEDIAKNDVVLPANTLIKSQHIAVMAAVGATKIKVFSKVKAAILSTGDELVEPQVKPGSSQIRNSNSWQLLTQVKRAGADAEYMGIVLDTMDDTREKLSKAIENSDIVFLSGGVSSGDYDYVPVIMKELGLEILFDSIAVQPGRPTTLAAGKGKFVFGLPGNPVSSFVQFELLGKMLMARMNNIEMPDRIVKCVCGADFTRKKAKRKSFYPVKLNEKGEIVPIEYHGSAHINSLNDAEGAIAMDIGVMEIKKGTLTDVRFF
ncbi:MAG: molybdopterin molybdotransferase MoeA [Bacteroidales bacterium]|nr:molybdopterin molybdotransferase MoeA [Bacteroidales bacterium]